MSAVGQAIWAEPRYGVPLSRVLRGVSHHIHTKILVILGYTVRTQFVRSWINVHIEETTLCIRMCNSLNVL
jgi:hypothetical protein